VGTAEKGAKTRPLNTEPPLSREGTPPGSAPVTRTFAARDDLELFTRRLSSAPAPLLPTPAATPRSRRIVAARAAVVESEVTDDGSREPPAITSSRTTSAPKSNAGFVLVVALSAAFVALAFALAPRDGARPMSGTSRAQQLVPLAAASQQPTVVGEIAATSPAPSPARVPRVASSTPKLLPQKAGEAAHATSGRSDSSTDADQLGTLRITADPRATIEVSGASFHELAQTPVLGLKVPAGRYQIVFRNDTFGTPVSAQVMVVAGSNRSVHADFRQAEPAVTVR